MKIVVLGGTGRTGVKIIEEGIRRGHKMSTIARTPEKLNGYDVEIIQGTPYEYRTVEKALNDCDAVINTINVSRKSDNPWASLRAPKDLISKSATHAIKAMETFGIKRFVALSTIGAGTSWKNIPFILKFIVSISNMKVAFLDHGKQEEVLKNSSMDYTICRAPLLSNEISNTGVVATPEGVKPASNVLSRNAAAGFFLDIIENNVLIKQTVSISNKPTV